MYLPPKETIKDKLVKSIPHIVAIAILALILLIVLTKFKWIPCDAVPGWCPVYCSIFGHSRIAFIHGDTGSGNPDLLKDMIMSQTWHITEDVPLSQVSYGYLQGFELVIVEHARVMSDGQLKAVENYLSGGGSVLWIGDAGIEDVNGTVSGFRRMKSYLLVDYANQTINDTVANMTTIGSHAITQGLLHNLPLTTSFAQVTVNEAVATKVAELKWHSETWPGIVENKYVGRVVYFSFPPEDLKSKAMISNLIGFLVSC